MVIPFMYEDGPIIQEKISHRVGDLNLEGRSKSLGKLVKVVCWKCKKEGHYKRDCKSKSLDK